MKPHVTIGVNYLERWHIIPKNRFFNVYLHKFSGSDDDRAMHDHPWYSFSIKLKGQMIEHRRTVLQDNGDITQNIKYGIPTRVPVRRLMFRPAGYAHRLELVSPVAYTLFITGPRIREWGFHCPERWKHWTLMSTPDGKPIGGCGE